jgi:hypothetical protein
MTASIAVAEMILVPVLTAIHARPRSDWPTTLLWAVASLVVTAAGGLVFPLLGEATIRALQGEKKSRLRVALYMALSTLIVIVLGFGFALIVSLGSHQGLLFARSDWVRLVTGSLFAPPMLAYAARDAIARRRSRSGWGIAEIPA